MPGATLPGNAVCGPEKGESAGQKQNGKAKNKMMDVQPDARAITGSVEMQGSG